MQDRILAGQLGAMARGSDWFAVDKCGDAARVARSEEFREGD